MAWQYNRLAQNRAINDQLTADRLQELNSDLDSLFAKLDPRDISITRNVLDYVTQIVDNINSITINIDWTSRDAEIPKLFIQEVWDTKKFTITYWVAWFPNSILYS